MAGILLHIVAFGTLMDRVGVMGWASLDSLGMGACVYLYDCDMTFIPG